MRTFCGFFVLKRIEEREFGIWKTEREEEQRCSNAYVFGSSTMGETRRYTNFTVPIGCSISQ